MIIDRTENKLFKRLSRNETQWRIKNVITCSKCIYGCCRESNPHCDYIGVEHKSKRCTGLTCIQRGIFQPRSDRVNVKRMKEKYNAWLEANIAGRPALEDLWKLLNDGQHGFDRDPELSGGGTLQGLFDSHQEGVQTDEVHEAKRTLKCPDWLERGN